MKFCPRWLVAVCLVLTWSPVQATSPIVAAASSLQFVFPELLEAFEAETGHSVRVNYGASGNFRRQIQQDAPFEVFLSADEINVKALEEVGLLEDESEVYAVGRLVWLQRAGRGDLPSAEAPLAGVQEALAGFERGEGRQRIALANPEHAPYGVAARQVLEQAGLWETTTPLRIFGENVSQAAQFALSDEARGGLVAESLVLAPPLAERGDFLLIPEAWHEPLVQRMALVKDAGLSGVALRWAAAAGGIGASAGMRAPGTAARRAIFSRGPGDPPPVAARTVPATRADSHPRPAGHSRPGRGGRPCRPALRAAWRKEPAGGRCRDALSSPGQRRGGTAAGSPQPVRGTGGGGP
nr:molybdate ABC transporter substrate-binding protein [Halomonas zhangzhouensis]